MPRKRKQSRPAEPQVPPLLPLDEIGFRLEKTLAESPADETEIVWLEARLGTARSKNRRVDVSERPQRTLLVRVLDRGRVGSFRTGSAELGDLANAVRSAMAQSRVREPLQGLPHLPADEAELEGPESLHDPEIGDIDGDGARALLMGLPAKGETLHLTWADARVAVFNSRNVRRSAKASAISLEVRTGRKPGSGRALDAARRLRSIDPRELLTRARRRSGRSEPAELPSGALPAVLSPSTVIELCDVLNRVSFSAKAYYDGTSFLREHINVQVFDRSFHLLDDGTSAEGIPFPFDLEGTAKRPVELIRQGAPKTPTLDQRQAAVLGLPPTAHAIGGNNAQAEHLFVPPGESSEEDLIAAMEDGIWIGWIDHVECFEPHRVLFRARAHGVRRIRDGKLAESLPDFLWEDSLLRLFSSLEGIADQQARRLSPDRYLGGICAPSIAVSSIELQNGRN